MQSMHFLLTASSIIMAIDKSNEIVVTADVEGNVKLWNIATYCLTEGSAECLYAPRKF